MATGYCIECDTTLNLGKSPHKGQKVTCFKCGAVLEVVGTSPIELDWALDEDFSVDGGFDIDYDFDYWRSSKEH
jgi:hypothetical protein